MHFRQFDLCFGRLGGNIGGNECDGPVRWSPASGKVSLDSGMHVSPDISRGMSVIRKIVAAGLRPSRRACLAEACEYQFIYIVDC